MQEELVGWDKDSLVREEEKKKKKPKKQR